MSKITLVFLTPVVGLFYWNSHLDQSAGVVSRAKFTLVFLWMVPLVFLWMVTLVFLTPVVGLWMVTHIFLTPVVGFHTIYNIK